MLKEEHVSYFLVLFDFFGWAEENEFSLGYNVF